MPLENTEAFVLKTQKYQETSKIINLYTRKFGKITLIAKGIRKADSKVGGMLESLNFVSIVFYYKPGRNIHLLKECDLVDSYIKIKDDFEKVSVAYAILELINRCVAEEEQNEGLFFLLIEIFKILLKNNKNLMNYYYYFILKFLEIIGFNINFKACEGCGESILSNIVSFKIEKGGVFCKTCTEKNNIDIRISPETFKILCKLQEISLKSLSNLTPSKKSIIEINQILYRFMMYHVEGFRVPISLGMF